MESGQVKSLREIAKKEGMDSNCVSRMLNLTTLAPDVSYVRSAERIPMQSRSRTHNDVPSSFVSAARSSIP